MVGERGAWWYGVLLKVQPSVLTGPQGTSGSAYSLNYASLSIQCWLSVEPFFCCSPGFPWFLPMFPPLFPIVPRFCTFAKKFSVSLGLLGLGDHCSLIG